MSLTSDYADSVIDRIEADDLSPDDVNLDPFVQDDEVAMTPELWEHLSEEKRQEFNERVREQGKKELEQAKRETADEHREKLKQIEEAVQDEDDAEPLTTTVPFGDSGEQVEVRARLSGRLERMVTQLNEFDDADFESADDLDHVVGLTLDIIQEVVVDDEWADRGLWKAYWREHGLDGLRAVVELFLEPALQRQERVQDSFPE